VSVEEEEGRFQKGMIVTLGVVLMIFGAWSAYTQSTRFTADDGNRLENRIDYVDAKLATEKSGTRRRLIQIEINQATILARLPMKFPPVETQRKIDELAKQLIAHEKQPHVEGR